MSDFNSIQSVREAQSLLSVTSIMEVPATTAIDPSNAVLVELVKQGGMIGALVLVCVFVWLLTQLIKVAKED